MSRHRSSGVATYRPTSRTLPHRPSSDPAAALPARQATGAKPETAAARRPRGDGVRLLTAAIAGGSVVAGHAVAGLSGTHLEDVALQAFTAPAPGPPGPADLGRSPILAAQVPMSTAGPGVDTALAVAPAADLSRIVDAATGAATAAVKDVVDARAARARDGAATPAGDAPVGPATCAAGTGGFGTVTDAVAQAGQQLRCKFSIDTVYGVAGRSNASDHPAGKALDFMTGRATGDRLAEYAAANMERLGISYVIYRQRINTGDGWEPMDDRGGATANHMDHVHVSFD